MECTAAASGQEATAQFGPGAYDRTLPRRNILYEPDIAGSARMAHEWARPGDTDEPRLHHGISVLVLERRVDL